VRGALAVGDNHIVIVNSAPPMLRWFDRQGKYVQGTGRTGGGPGEFQSLEGGAGQIYAVWPVGPDSIATWEHSERRMQVFDAHARYIRAVTLELPAQGQALTYPGLVSGMSNEGFMAFHAPHCESVAASGTWRDTTTYTWWSKEGKYTGNSVRLPSFEVFNTEFRGRRMAGRPPFARPPAAWNDSNRLYYGSADRFEIAIYELPGALKLLIRRDAPRRAVTDAIIASYIAERMQEAPQDPAMRREWENSLRQSPYPDSLPAYRRIRVDRAGALWVQDYDVPAEQDVAWHVFDRAGRMLSSVTLPRAWQIQDIGRDYVLVLARNELDVQVVRMYGLRREALK